MESTSKDPWNVSNTKLQLLADHTYNWEDYQVIMKHLWEKLTLKPKEWRRIAKALHVMDYLVKNGAPRIIQDLKDDLYKIRVFQDFSYKENNVQQGTELRDKAKQLCELLNDPKKI
jgi:epsin